MSGDDQQPPSPWEWPLAIVFATALGVFVAYHELRIWGWFGE